MKSFVFGQSATDLPIVGYEFGQSGPRVLILGGVHGDEPEGVVAAYGLLKRFSVSFTYKLQLTLIPAFNPDGVLAKNRVNGNKVDLNRNLPTNDWSPVVVTERYHPGPRAASEPENQALINYLNTTKTCFVLSLHSWKPMLNINGNCQKEAEVISKHVGYEIQPSIGYPTPGCLGTYCGLERDIPTLTYEIERGLDTKRILDIHVPAILEALKVTEERG